MRPAKALGLATCRTTEEPEFVTAVNVEPLFVETELKMGRKNAMEAMTVNVLCSPVVRTVPVRHHRFVAMELWMSIRVNNAKRVWIV